MDHESTAKLLKEKLERKRSLAGRIGALNSAISRPDFVFRITAGPNIAVAVNATDVIPVLELERDRASDELNAINRTLEAIGTLMNEPNGQA